MTKKQANIYLLGTGYYIDRITKKKRAVVVSEGCGEFLFHCKNIKSAVKRCMTRDIPKMRL